MGARARARACVCVCVCECVCYCKAPCAPTLCIRRALYKSRLLCDTTTTTDRQYYYYYYQHHCYYYCVVLFLLDRSFWLQVRTPHDDVNSVTSGETTTSDSGRGGSEDDTALPPIAEVPPECGSKYTFCLVFSSSVCSGLLRTQKWISVSFENPGPTKCCPFKAWNRSECSHACFVCCQEFLPCTNFCLFGPFILIYIYIYNYFFKSSPLILTVLGLANAVSCVGLRNTICDPARFGNQFMQVPVLSGKVCETVNLADVCLWFPKCCWSIQPVTV